jgi:ATP-dependent protease ClpP protease subunit
MKKFFVALLLIMSILIGGCTSTPVFNSWTDTLPGVSIITGNMTDTDFKKFYFETELFDGDEYRIVLNTNGGEAMACIGIMQRIEEMQSRGIKVITETYSKGYSAGSFIFAMGDVRIMHPGSSLMWHTITGQAYADGREDALKSNPAHYNLLTQMDHHVINKMKEKHPQVGDDVWNYLLLNSGMSFMFPEAACDLGIATTCIQ